MIPIKFVDRFNVGFQVIMEAVEGEYLLGGRMGIGRHRV
jgi:hypothetical protein